MEELGHTLASLRLPLSADMFLRRLSPRPLDQPHYRVGVIGHRAWNTEGVEEKVRERLRILRQQNPDRPLAIVSSLAEGADRLVVNEARALDPETSLIAVLPMPAEEYAKDFQPSETTTAVGTPADTPSAAEFWELLCSASEIHLAGPTDDWSTDNGRNRAYRRAARALVDGCDFLIVVWDGKAARGEGGTGETVAYADQVKLPIDLISVTRDLPAPPPAIPPTGDRALNTHAASNPWWCVSADTDPPALERTSTSASQRIAELLWGWPGTSPPCYWSPEERLQRLLACVAGKAELSPGVTAWDQVTHPLAWQATGLALDLDGMPPIAGRESLRSELLWLDRAYRCGELAEHGLDAGMLIRILVAWLTTGELLAWRSSKRVGRQPGLLWRLLMTLYHPRAVDHERKLIGSACRAVERLASRLGGVTAIRPGAHITIEDPSDFPRFAETGGTPPAFSDQDVLRALIHRLWWARSRVALRAKNALHTETAPTLACDRESRVVDVRFHGIQRWLRLSRERGGLSVTSKGHSEAKAPRMYARTGASAFLELVTSELRRMLVSTLGYGSTLIDGGGRLRFRLLSSMSKVNENATSIDIEARVYDTLERVFLLNPTLSRTLVHEWQEAGGPISRERPGTGADESQIPRSVAIDLARELLPPVSITVWDSSDPAARPLQVPVRWRHGDAPATPSSVVVSPAAVLVELGMTTPIHRALHVGGAQGHQALLPRAPVREAIEQYMVLDLNRVGELFTRDRGEISLSLEAAARRSFRFSAHWIRALHQAVYVQNDPQLEISIHGGDDIVVISRNPHSSLKDFAAELDAQLWRLNRELPPCDRVSFAAGLITKKEKPGKEEPLAFARAAGALEEFAKASSRCDHEDFRCALVDKYWNAQAKYQRIRLGDGTNRKSVLATAEWTNPYPNPMHQASLHPDVAVTPIPCDKVDLASPWRPVETEWLLNFLDQLAVRRASGTGDGRNLSFEIELVAGKKHAELRLFEGRVKPPKSTCTRAGHRACAGCEKFLEAP